MISLGVLFISKAGGLVFENVSIFGPFVLVGLLDLAFIVFIVILMVLGKFNH